MSYIVNLEQTYKSLWFNLIQYITTNNFDNEAKSLYNEITLFENFCKVYFNINIKETLPQA